MRNDAPLFPDDRWHTCTTCSKSVPYKTGVSWTGLTDTYVMSHWSPANDPLIPILSAMMVATFPWCPGSGEVIERQGEFNRLGRLLRALGYDASKKPWPNYHRFDVDHEIG